MDEKEEEATKIQVWQIKGIQKAMKKFKSAMW